MSDTPPRRPAAFSVDPLNVLRNRTSEDPLREPRAIADLARVRIETDDALEAEALEALEATPATGRSRGGFSFARLLLAALGAIVSLALTMALDAFVRDLFARADWLGYLALGLSAAALVGLVGVIGHELRGILKLNIVERERRDGSEAYRTDDERAARNVVERLVSLLSHKAETAHGRERLLHTKEDIIDGRDLICLAERELLLPLDAKARALVLGSAKRVSVVTAVSPRAIVDLLFVLFETVRLIRAMSELYGARPGTIGLIRLTRDVLAHLAVTGSIAVGDSLVQQVVGHGLAAKISAKLGEGVVNGLLSARIGLAAMDLCRPLPFLSVERPGIAGIFRDLTHSNSAPGR